MNTRLKAGLNGSGRFGLHLLQYWIENYGDAMFDILYINDDFLNFDKFKQIIQEDEYLSLRSYIEFDADENIIVKGQGIDQRIKYTNLPLEDISWLGTVDVFLECSGKHTGRQGWEVILTGSTLSVVISATSWTADQICVYGYNHTSINVRNQRVLSYGSCTVNAYIPLASFINNMWGVTESDVSVIHNVPVHQIKQFNTLERRNCTLEQVASKILPFLNDDNFKVTYTLVPYTGVSMIDFRFKLNKSMTRDTIIAGLRSSIKEGELHKLYSIADMDNGPGEHKFTRSSAVIIESSVSTKGNNLYISAYFDNENSANRYYDTVNYITQESLRGE